MKSLRTSILCAAVVLAGPVAADMTSQIAISGADNTCPTGYRLMEYSEVSVSGANDRKTDDLTVLGNAVCRMAGQWDILRLAGGGSFGGRGYECHHFNADTRPLGGSVCIKGEINIGYDRPGGDLNVLVNPRPTNLAECEAACIDNVQCGSWTFETNPGGACHLKAGQQPMGGANQTLISGTTGQ